MTRPTFEAAALVAFLLFLALLTLTFAAGTLNYPFWRFTILVLVGKAGRYAALWAGWASFA